MLMNPEKLPSQTHAIQTNNGKLYAKQAHHYNQPHYFQQPQYHHSYRQPQPPPPGTFFGSGHPFDHQNGMHNHQSQYYLDHGHQNYNNNQNIWAQQNNPFASLMPSSHIPHHKNAHEDSESRFENKFDQLSLQMQAKQGNTTHSPKQEQISAERVNLKVNNSSSAPAKLNSDQEDQLIDQNKTNTKGLDNSSQVQMSQMATTVSFNSMKSKSGQEYYQQDQEKQRGPIKTKEFAENLEDSKSATLSQSKLPPLVSFAEQSSDESYDDDDQLDTVPSQSAKISQSLGRRARSDTNNLQVRCFDKAKILIAPKPSEIPPPMF